MCVGHEEDVFMEPSNTAERGPALEGESREEHRNDNRRLRELDWKSLPCVELPRPSFSRDEWRRKPKSPPANDVFEVRADGWRIKSV
jgi:hypothetical protein